MAPTSPRSKTYPIAETFTSVQGEGVYTGTLMHFIRLAGCNVGKYASEGHELEAHEPDFPLWAEKKHSICESILGQRFLCDTNYHTVEHCTSEELMRRAGLVEHICITGGEPFLHDLEDLIVHVGAERLVHIETSGTKPIQWIPKLPGTWITCAPKIGFLDENIDRVDEWKFVVSKPADFRGVMSFLREHGIDSEKVPVYVQPVNYVESVNTDCINMVLAQLEHYPTLRLSAQLHKYLGVR